MNRTKEELSELIKPLHAIVKEEVRESGTVVYRLSVRHTAYTDNEGGHLLSADLGKERRLSTMAMGILSLAITRYYQKLEQTGDRITDEELDQMIELMFQELQLLSRE